MSHPFVVSARRWSQQTGLVLLAFLTSAASSAAGDLVVDGTPLTVMHVIGAEDPAPHVVQVANVGGTPLFWAVTADPPVAWLQTDVTSGTIAPAGAQAVTLTFLPVGVAAGSHATTLRFVNVAEPPDEAGLPVTLSVDHGLFVVGDRLIGLVDQFHHATDVVCDAVEGMLLKLTFRKTPAHKTRVSVQLIDPQGEIEQAFVFTFRPDKEHHRNKKLKRSGRYTLRVTPLDGDLGVYEIDTARKLPKSAAGFTKKHVAPHGGKDSVTLKVAALPGAQIDMVIKPVQGFAGAPLLSIVTPLGTLLDTTGFVTDTPQGGLKLTGLPLPLAGKYHFEIGGFVAKQDEITAKVDLQQPAKGEATVVVP